MGPRLMLADYFSPPEDPKAAPDQNPKQAEKNDKGLAISHLHTFEDNPVMWIHRDKRSLKIIFRNRDYLDIPYINRFFCTLPNVLLKGMR